MATVKLLLILVTVPAQFYAGTPPNARPPAEQLRDQSPLERLLPHLSWISKVCSPHCLTPTSLIAPQIIACAWAALELVRLAPPTPAFVTGTLLILAGAALRALCFRTLGASFTFELAIRPAHALVTRGVYAIVRHPSYTGIFALVAGWLLCLADYRACIVDMLGGNDGVVTAVMACMGATMMGTCYVMLSRRMDKEDAMLEDNFGEEWRAWVKRVPYRLVPGVC